MTKAPRPFAPKRLPQQELIDSDGLCRASIRTAEEIEGIQAEVDGAAPWFDDMTSRLEAIKDPTRFKLVFLLYRYGQLCVCDLANILGVTSSAISQHLRRLKDMGFVSAHRDKQTMFYSISDPSFAAFLDRLGDFAPEPERAVAS